MRELFGLAVFAAIVGIAIGVWSNKRKANKHREIAAALSIPTVVAATKDAVRQSTTADSDFVAKIEHNLHLLEELADAVYEAENWRAIFPKVLSDVQRLAVSYEGLAASRDRIQEKLHTQFEKIREQQDLVSERKRIVEAKVHSIERQLKHEGDEIERAALAARLPMAKKELEVWERFEDRLKFMELKGELERLENGIDRFIRVLEANGKVYRQAYDTLKAMDEYMRAGQDLRSLLRVVDLSDELIASWSEVADIVGKMTAHIAEVDEEFGAQ